MASPDATTYPTMEKQAVGILTRMNAAEASATQNSQSRNYVRTSYDQDSGIFTASVSIPATWTVNASGEPVLDVQSYLSDP